MNSRRACSFVVWISVSCCLGAQLAPEAREHAQRAQDAIRSNQPDVAEAELKALLRLAPQDANAWASLGMVQFTSGRYLQAESNFTAALERAPASWNAKAFLGMCEIRLGQTHQGQPDIETALDHIKDKRLRRQASLELVNSYANTGLTEKAAQRVEMLQQEDPESPDVLYAVYRIHSALASAALQKLSQISPESARVHQVLGDDLLAQENYRRAIDEYKEALKRDPHLAGIHLGIAQALLGQGRDKQNIAAAEDALLAELAIDSGNPDALFQLGQINYQRGDVAKAADLFNASLKRRPQYPDAQIALAKICSDSNRNTEAMKYLQSALETAPSNRTAHYRLAQLYKKSGRPAQAEEEFEIARRLSDSRPSGMAGQDGAKQ